MSDWVADVNHSLNLVVLRTPPGSARRRVRLDRAGMADILGTVAGDDTLIVVAECSAAPNSPSGCSRSPDSPDPSPTREKYLNHEGRTCLRRWSRHLHHPALAPGDV